MTSRPRLVLATVLLGALAALTSGCEIGDDDEMVAPTRTVTASPAAPTTAVPDSVPAGRDVVRPGDVVWAQGTVLHVSGRKVDLSPVGVDAFVAAPGGIYLLHQGELWFTDLSRLKGTGITGVTALESTLDGSRIKVTVTGSGSPTVHAFDTGDGRAVPAEDVDAATARDRLRGPDSSGVRVPVGFELAGWSGPDTFYGLARAGEGSAELVACEVTTRSCEPVATVDSELPVRFGTGT